MKTNEHQFRSPVVSPQDYFDDIERRSWETSDAWSNQLVHGPWQMNNLRGNCPGGGAVKYEMDTGVRPALRQAGAFGESTGSKNEGSLGESMIFGIR